jgi:hypothetical protein
LLGNACTLASVRPATINSWPAAAQPGAERIGHRSSTKNTGSLTKLAREELWKLWEEEKKIAKRGDHAKWFSRLEVACMTVGTAGSAERAAATATVPVVSVPVALLAFAGWPTC